MPGTVFGSTFALFTSQLLRLCRSSFAIEYLDAPVLHLSPPAPLLRSRRIFRYRGWSREENRQVNCIAAPMLVGPRRRPFVITSPYPTRTKPLARRTLPRGCAQRFSATA